MTGLPFLHNALSGTRGKLPGALGRKSLGPVTGGGRSLIRVAVSRVPRSSIVDALRHAMSVEDLEIEEWSVQPRLPSVSKMLRLAMIRTSLLASIAGNL